MRRLKNHRKTHQLLKCPKCQNLIVGSSLTMHKRKCLTTKPIHQTDFKSSRDSSRFLHDHNYFKTKEPHYQPVLPMLSTLPQSALSMAESVKDDGALSLGVRTGADQLEEIKETNGALSDSCPPVEEAERPAKSKLYRTAAQILEKSRALFEIKLSSSLPEVSSPAPAPAVRKDLQDLPQKLIDKILAKEAAKERFTDKSKEDKVRSLRRLLEISRLVKSVFISERKVAVLTTVITKRVVASYPGIISEEIIKKDLRYLVEVTTGFLSFVCVQGQEYVKLNQGIDINNVVSHIKILINNSM